MARIDDEFIKRLLRQRLLRQRGRGPDEVGDPSVVDMRDLSPVERALLSVAGLFSGAGAAFGLARKLGPFGVVGGSPAPRVGSDEFARAIELSRLAKSRRAGTRTGTGKGSAGRGRNEPGRGAFGDRTSDRAGSGGLGGF